MLTADRQRLDDGGYHPISPPGAPGSGELNVHFCKRMVLRNCSIHTFKEQSELAEMIIAMPVKTINKCIQLCVVMKAEMQIVFIVLFLCTYSY